ncbi:MAG: ABC transporter permease [Chloroflexia bacterium]|nr:ABC transporter permease [Chloroflexia bacterium]
MLRPALRRLILLLMTVIAASSLLFVLIHLGGDPIDGFVAPGSSPEVRQQVRDRIGLDRPLTEQYGVYIWRGLTGDFGESWRDRQPALAAVLARLPTTLGLAGVAIVIAVVAGVSAGIMSALPWPGPIQAAVRLLAMVGQAIPSFWLGTLCIFLFAATLGWLPASGNDGWRSVILPAFTVAAYPGSVLARIIQASMIERSSRPYVTTARGKGLRERTVWIRHVLPNAVLPALGFMGVQAGFLVGGTIVVESVFAYPGIGRLALQAATERDLPVLHAFVVVTVLLVSAVNIVIDAVSRGIDPRQRQRSTPGLGAAPG